jgi:hypothetical protein
MSYRYYTTNYPTKVLCYTLSHIFQINAPLVERFALTVGKKDARVKGIPGEQAMSHFT